MRVGSIFVVCRDPQTGESVAAPVSEGGGFEIINPPPEAASSSLNNQNINLNYSANNLDVNGITKSADSRILCSQGVAGNYILKLTGSNVVDGKINLGGGAPLECH